LAGRRAWARRLLKRAGMSHALVVETPLPKLDLPRLAQRLADELGEIDRQLRYAGQTVPSPEIKTDVARRFWAFADLAAELEADGAAGGDVRARCRDILGRWLYRSRYWNRSFHKPHGYAGDYAMIEWIYDLESDRCEDPTQPGIVNCLDFLYSTADAVPALWHRRRWFADLLRAEHQRRGGELRVLDVACGGARYMRDFLMTAGDVSRVAITLADQDAAALAFCRGRSLVQWNAQIETVPSSIVKLAGRLAERRFDVVISAGLFDYLNEAVATRVLGQLASLLAPGGVVAFSNFHVGDGSRLLKDWFLDWPLVYREDRECAALMPAALAVATARSENRALVYATGRRVET
jgi:extracellular factor (EF) 3-hydroxypalmitic acid methyl ester biosynthesis protein